MLNSFYSILSWRVICHPQSEKPQSRVKLQKMPISAGFFSARNLDGRTAVKIGDKKLFWEMFGYLLTGLITFRSYLKTLSFINYYSVVMNQDGHFRWLYFTLNLMLGFDIRSINSLITQEGAELFFLKPPFTWWMERVCLDIMGEYAGGLLVNLPSKNHKSCKHQRLPVDVGPSFGH